MELFNDTYTKEVAVEGIGIFLGTVGTSVDFLIGIDLADEIVDGWLTLDDAVAPDQAQQFVSQGLEDISADADALAAAQAALGITAPVESANASLIYPIALMGG